MSHLQNGDHHNSIIAQERRRQSEASKGMIIEEETSPVDGKYEKYTSPKELNGG